MEDAFDIKPDVIDRIVQAIASVTPHSGIRVLGTHGPTGLVGSAPAGPELLGFPPPNQPSFFPVPGRDALGKLISTALCASQILDEGRHARFRLVVADTTLQPSSLLLELSPALPFSADAVGKLAMCTAFETGALVVGTDARLIWSLAEVSTVRRHWFSHLSLEVDRPGSLVIRFLRRECARFADLRVQILAGRCFDEYAATKTMANVVDFGPFPRSHQLGSTLLRIAWEIRARGHGGTLLVARTTVGLKPKFPVVASPLHKLFGPDVENPKGLPPDLVADLEAAREKELDAAIRQVAGLSQTDGAVLLTPSLEVRGFGCFVQLAADGAATAEVTEVDGRELGSEVAAARSAVHVGGARHQSAVAFVSANPGSVALVVSQDGDVSMVARLSDGGVLLVRPVVEGPS